MTFWSRFKVIGTLTITGNHPPVGPVQFTPLMRLNLRTGETVTFDDNVRKCLDARLSMRRGAPVCPSAPLLEGGA